MLFIIRITSDDLLFQEMKVNWATSPGNQPKQDTSSKYGVTLRCYVGGNMFYQVVWFLNVITYDCEIIIERGSNVGLL